MNENLRNFKDHDNNGKIDLKKAMHESSVSWKAMSDAQKQVCHYSDLLVVRHAWLNKE